ncbi:MAG: class I SAM-dependent methyltransferase [Anaerolineales bacterium]|nr:class I SAM-dependent methyltransferase [Anaerolineales bacterium]
MPENVSICALCGSNRNALFDRRRFRGREVTNRICLDCGLVFQSPRMTAAEAETFYLEEYRRLYEGSAGPTERNMKVQQARAEWLVAFIGSSASAVTRHLDIGCSVGILLQRVQAVYRNEAVGVEPDEVHRAHAIQIQLRVYPSLGALESAGEERFDLISMSHVLEHLTDPVDYLTHLRERLLTPDGWLLLEVPNLYAHDCFEIAHLYAFSQHTLGEVLRRSGFELVKFEKHGHPNSALFQLYLTALCRPAVSPDEHPVRPERNVRLKRNIGMLWRKLLERLLPRLAWRKIE